MNFYELAAYLLHRTDVKLTNHFTKQLKPYSITPEQWTIICILDTEQATLQKDLAREIDKDQTTVVRMIHSLEKKGLVKRLDNHSDRRSQNLFLTDRGRTLLQEIEVVVKDTHEYVTRGLSFEEIEQLKKTLNKLYSNVNDK